MTASALCTITGCDKAVRARDMCIKHWKRWRTHGDPAVTLRDKTFWDYVDRRGPDECWPWKGATAGKPPRVYGRFKHNGRVMNAHVVAWILTNGELPELPDADFRGTCILHSCDTPICCNPSHGSPGTHLDNMKDKKAKHRDTSEKPFCVAGHPRTPENLYVSKKGLRACRECHRISAQRQRVRKRVGESASF